MYCDCEFGGDFFNSIYLQNEDCMNGDNTSHCKKQIQKYIRNSNVIIIIKTFSEINLHNLHKCLILQNMALLVGDSL